MTTKEKAEELVRKFKPFVQFKMGVEQSYVLRMAKQCALVAVDEIVEGYEFDSLDIEHRRIMDNINFWDKVKQEIEKL